MAGNLFQRLGKITAEQLFGGVVMLIFGVIGTLFFSKTVRKWIVDHTRCRAKNLYSTGFGLAATEAEVKAANLSREDKETILAELRHVVLFIPRRQLP